MLAGDPTRYDRVEDHDIDGDSDPSQHQTSGTDTEASFANPRIASRSIVRRRRQEPQVSPIKAMSLVGLKNIFFKQTVTPVPKRTKSSSDYGRTPSSPFPAYPESACQLVF